MTHKLGLVFILIISTLYVFGQEIPYKHFESENGLASSEVYNMYLDKTGYIWFATNKGISRFDGKEFENFTTKDGLPENSHVRIFQDTNGRIWFSSYSGYLSYFENERIFAHPLNYDIGVKSNNYYTDFLYTDSLGVMWFAPSKGRLFNVYEGRSVSEVDTAELKRNGASMLIRQVPEGSFMLKLNYGKPPLKHGSAPEIEVDGNDTYLYLDEVVDNVRIQRYLHRISDSETLLSVDNIAIYIKDGKVADYKKFDTDITSIYCDNTGSFWISHLFEGVHIFSNKSFSEEKRTLLEGITISSIKQDREGNYWVSTVENGVFFYPSFAFLNYDLSDINNNSSVLAFDVVGNDMYFSTYDKKVFKAKVNGKRLTDIKPYELEDLIISPVMDIYCESENSIWIVGTQSINYNASGRKRSNITAPVDFFRIMKGSDDMVYLTRAQGFVGFKHKRKVFDYRYERYYVPTAIAEAPNGVLWLGSLDGLYYFKNNRLKYHGHVHDVFKSRIADIQFTPNRHWVATWGAGLAIVENDSIMVLTEENGIRSDFVNVMYADNDSVMWIGTNKGLNKVTYPTNGKVQISKYSRSDGLPSNEIKGVKRHNGILWVATTQGLTAFSDKEFRSPKVAPMVKFEKIIVNNTDTVILDSYVLSHKNNSLTFNYSAIGYRNPERMQFRYRLEGHDPSIVYTKNTYVQYNNLNPGNYVFYVNSSDDHGNWSSEPTKVQITIKRPYYATSWFILLLVFLIASIIVIVSYSIINYYRIEADTKKKLMMAEQKALRSQMNPHFLFNALNSIKRFILDNDSDAADDYLTGFAMLMRKVLNNSKEYTISLPEEIETLKLYLNLEMMRFDERFKYHIHVEAKLPLYKMMIPPMIIQPYLENAIWHGLMPKKGEGSLYISFTGQSESHFRVSIVDNGIGRNKSSAMKPKNSKHQSTGLKNIDERIGLLNKVNKVNIRSEILDMYDKDNKASGTKIVIDIPWLLA